MCSNELFKHVPIMILTSYYVIIALAPEIIEFPLDVKTFEGSTTTIITCKPYGVPKPHIKWIRNRIELTGGRYSISDSGDLEIRLVKKMYGI